MSLSDFERKYEFEGRNGAGAGGLNQPRIARKTVYMRESGIDAAKIKKWARRIAPHDLVWLRETVGYGLTTDNDLGEFVLVALNRSYDSQIHEREIRVLVQEFSSEEIVWFCDHYKQPPLREKRKESRGVRQKWNR